jgi:hypothetical protein
MIQDWLLRTILVALDPFQFESTTHRSGTRLCRCIPTFSMLWVARMAEASVVNTVKRGKNMIAIFIAIRF